MNSTKMITFLYGHSSMCKRNSLSNMHHFKSFRGSNLLKRRFQYESYHTKNFIIKNVSRNTKTSTPPIILLEPCIKFPFLGCIRFIQQKTFNHNTVSGIKEGRNRILATSVSEKESMSVVLSEDFSSILQKLVQLGRNIAHLLRLGILFSPLIAITPCLLLWNRSTDISMLPEWYWKYAMWTIEHSSAALIKFIQWSSTRRDTFSETFCNRFQYLHSHSPLHSWEVTERTMQKCYGSKWHEIFDLEHEPVGSGCVAQVYKGKLIKGGEEIAVKIIHPEIRESILRDFELMESLCYFVEFFSFSKWLSVRESVNEFRHIMMQQMNMEKEAENLLLFRKAFQKNKKVRFPEPKIELTCKNVLVESYEHGIPISEYFNDSIDPSIAKALAKNCLDIFLSMVFLNNFAHGDLHPGNILVSTDKINNGKVPQMIWLDAGIVTELSLKDQANLIDLLYEVVNGNGNNAGKLMLDRAPYHACVNPDIFCSDIDRIVQNALSSNINLSHVHVGKLLGNVMNTCCSHHVKLQARYTSIIISIGVIEGVARSLDSNLNILSSALPIILKSKIRYSSFHEQTS